MDLINLSLLLSVILFSVVGGLIAAKKALGKKAVNLALLLVAFFGTVIVLSAGVLDVLGDLLMGLIGKELGAIGGIASGFINFIIRVFVFDIVFWVVYLVLKIVASIVLAIIRVKRFSAFQKPQKNNVVAGVLGGVTAWFFCLLSLLPIFAITTLATPALAEASKEEYSDTYAYELATVVNDKYSFVTDNSYVNVAAKITGARALINYALNSFGEAEFESNGVTTEYNVYGLIREVATLGVDGVVLYERSMSGGHTYGEMHVVVDMVETLSGSSSLVSMASGLISSNVTEIGGEGIMGEVLGSVTNSLTGDNAESNLQNDLTVIKDILDDFITKNNDKEFLADHISDDLVEYLLDKDNADKIVENLSHLSSFKEVTTALSSYGVYAICEMMEIPENKQEAFEAFNAKLLTELNDRSVSVIDYEDLDGFIKYLSDNQITVEGYRQDNVDAESGEDDVAIQNYDEYFSRTDKVNSVFVNYQIEELDGKRVYISSNGETYIYDEASDLWSASSLTEIKNAHMLSEFLVKKVDLFLESDTEITKNSFNDFLNEFISQNSNVNEYANFNVSFAQKLLSVDAFTTTLITEEDVISSVDEDADVSNAASALKEILVSASIVLEMGGGNGDIAEVLLNNFSQVGKVLDALHGYGITKNIPETLLKAIAQKEEFSAYFAYESIVKITDNVKQGKSTYTELFTAVQSLYKIASEVL